MVILLSGCSDDIVLDKIICATLDMYDCILKNKCVNKFIINQIGYFKEQLTQIRKCEGSCVLKDLISLNNEQKEMQQILIVYIRERCL